MTGHPKGRTATLLASRSGAPVRSANAYGIDLLWIPVGAGGWFVRNNGRMYERVKAWRERRPPRTLYHTALKVRVPRGSYVVESAWPIPDERGAARGVVVEGPVFSARLARFRALRYEVRVWKEGVIFDEAWAASESGRVSANVDVARKVLAVAPSVPPFVWGRDKDRTGEMWNSNSVIAWLLTQAGVPMEKIQPPPGGRAPGWDAGIAVARRDKGPWMRVQA